MGFKKLTREAYPTSADDAARDAYTIADAMLKARGEDR